MKLGSSADNCSKLVAPLCVEAAHVYADEAIGEEQRESLSLLETLQGRLSEPRRLLVLLDDYNTTEVRLSLDDVEKELAVLGHKPDAVVSERTLVPLAHEVLAALPSTPLASSTRRYVEKKQALPCSLLSATWYLARLGLAPPSSRRVFGLPPAKTVLNLIPDRYEEIDALARKLVDQATDGAACGRVHTLFFPR